MLPVWVDPTLKQSRCPNTELMREGEGSVPPSAQSDFADRFVSCSTSISPSVPIDSCVDARSGWK